MRNLIILAFIFSVFVTNAQTISTVAGNGTAGFAGDGAAATLCELNGPYGLCFDTVGNLYIADALNHRIRKLSTTGIITTVAGTGVAGYSGDGGQATSAKLYRPTNIVFDTHGNLFISDEFNNVIRKINTSGIISTYAGTGVSGYSGDGGLATSAQLTRTNRVSIDGAGNLYISLYQNSVIRKVSTSGIITTIAGNGTAGFSGDGGLATSAQLNLPGRAIADKFGNIFIADEYNNRIRKISTSGIITTVVGNGAAAYSGDGSLATSASINFPEAITVDNFGNLYLPDKGNHVIRKINTSGIISTIAGTGNQGYSGDGGLAVSASLYYPEEIFFDDNGNMLFSDWGNNAIRKVTNVTIGINQVKNIENNFALYPNPATDLLNISISYLDEPISYQIFNVLGQEEKSGKLNTILNQVDLTNISSGVYSVVFTQGGRTSATKICVHK